MDNNFTKAMQFVGKWEWGNRKDGGYTNDPVDPGGETRWGISKRAHPDLDIKNLTFSQALDVYWNEYWKPAKCDILELPMAVAMFDTAVNVGVERATGWLDEGDTYKNLLARRINYYSNLVRLKPQMNKFYKGWINRVVDLRKYCDILTNETS